MEENVEGLNDGFEISSEIVNAMKKSLREVDTDPLVRSSTPIQTQIEPNKLPSTSSEQSYQLWNHQYTESAPNKNIADILQEWNFIDSHPGNRRRASIEDVFKVRQYLNPRSSFTCCSTNNRCWITMIKKVSEIPCVIALNSSIRTHGSKILLCVVIPDNWTVELPNLAFVKFLRQPLPIVQNENLFLLTLWNNLDYEFCCYISPYAILQNNIDGMLLDEEVFQEIDNETCVLLANQTYKRKNEIVILIFKPSSEIKIVVQEFLSVYNSDSGKLKQLENCDAWDALNALFGEAWGVVSEDCCQTLADDETVKDVSLLNFCYLKPWQDRKLGNCGIWWNYYNQIPNIISE